MSPTSKVMRRHIGRTISALREHMRVGQAEFARALGKYTEGRPPDQAQISRWERGEVLPSPAHRAALARLAEKHKKEELAEVLRAPVSAWRLVALVEKHGWV